MAALPLRTLALTTVLALGAVVAGCGSDPDASRSSTPTDASSSTSSSTSPGPSSGTPQGSGSVSPSVAVSPLPAGVATYVALGDSYTAAPGVPSTELDDGCLRSDGNYPSLLAAASSDITLTDVSCSGASTTSLVGVQQTGRAQLPAQFDALKSDTDLVTLGIGGNDEDLFSTAVVTCLQLAGSDPTGSPCHDAEQQDGKDVLLAKVRQTRGLVTAALRGVRDRSPSATVLLVGYPQPVPASGTCSALPLATGDYAYIRQVFGALDTTLQKAAAKAGATYVDVATPSKGHDICSADPWVNGAENAPGQAIAFHPFAEEQAAVADLVAGAAAKAQQ